jgi:uncharacterized protein (DUF2141 family)
MLLIFQSSTKTAREPFFLTISPNSCMTLAIFLRKSAIFLLCLGTAMLLASVRPAGHTLTVEAHNLDSDSGYVLLILFKGEEGFPSDAERAHAYTGELVKGKKATLQFRDLPSGEYAIAALHDENSNGKMDTNMLGIPKEAYGASNDANNPFGPPKYADARFTLSSDTTLRIRMRRIFQ